MELKFSKIVDRDLKKAEMYLYGALGSDTGELNGHFFAEELSWMGRNYDEITIRINSEGGDVLHGLSIISEMMVSKAYIIASVDGIAASMAAVILAAADKVRMNDYARVMIHSPYYVDENGAAQSKLTEKQKKGLANVKDMLAKLLEKRGITPDRVNELLKTDSWFDAEAALSEKLIDEVITTGRKAELVALEPMKLVVKLVEENKVIDNPKIDKSMKRIALAFGLGEDATEEAILAKKTEAENAATTKMVDELVKMGRVLGTVNDENVEKVKRLAKADFDLAAEMYLVAPEVEETEEETAGEKKTTLIKDSLKKGGKETKVEKKFNELSATELETLREKDRPAYAKLYKEYYGFEASID